MKLCSLVLLTLLVFVTGQRSTTPEVSTLTRQKPLVVILLRHAEKVDASEDPELTDQGQERAKQLAMMLRDTKIDQIHSSDFKRTRSTAMPLATGRELNVTTYDPRKLQEFAERLMESGGVHVVIGHSNTTPKLTELLGGQPGSPIDDSSEFDRLYIVTVGEDGTTQTVVMRYGDPS